MIFVLNLVAHITLAASAALIASLLLKRHAAIRHTFLLVALAFIAVAPLSTLGFQQLGWSLISLPDPLAPRVGIEMQLPEWELRANAEGAGLGSYPNLDGKAFLEQVSPSETRNSNKFPTHHIWNGLWVVWILGIMLGLARLAFGYQELRRILDEAKPTSEGEAALLNEITFQIGPKEIPELRITDRLQGPVALGIWRQRILLPTWVLHKTSVDDRRQILAHELAHIVRRDGAVTLLQNLIGIAFWFHPLVHALNRRLARAREELCDNFVLTTPGSTGPGYSRLLLRIAQWIEEEAPLPTTASLWTSHWKLETRVAGILDQHRNRSTQVTKCEMGLAILFASSILATSLLTTVVPADEDTRNRAQLETLPNGSNGIAAKFPGDHGIEQHPSVLFADGFENHANTSQLNRNWDVTHGLELNVARGEEAHHGRQALLFTVPPTNGESASGSGIAKTLSEPQDVLFLRWYEKYDPDWNIPKQWADHGALISASFFRDGQPSPETMADGRNQFLVGVGNINMFGDLPGNLGVYLNWPKQAKQWGDYAFPSGLVVPDSETRSGTILFGEAFEPRSEFTPELGRWYCYETMVEANKPGQPDGRISIWVDGNLVADFPNLRLRDVPDLKIDRIDFDVFLKHTDHTNRKWIDNVVAATSYIGPMQRGSEQR